MPMHTYLKGKPIDSQGNEPHRTFDCDARGCGGSWTVPTCSAGTPPLTWALRSSSSRSCPLTLPLPHEHHTSSRRTHDEVNKPPAFAVRSTEAFRKLDKERL